MVLYSPYLKWASGRDDAPLNPVSRSCWRREGQIENSDQGLNNPGLFLLVVAVASMPEMWLTGRVSDRKNGEYGLSRYP